MQEETLNMSVRKFLKKVGVTSQREIEQAIRQAVDTGKLQGDEELEVRMTLVVEHLDLSHTVDGTINLV